MHIILLLPSQNNLQADKTAATNTLYRAESCEGGTRNTPKYQVGNIDGVSLIISRYKSPPSALTCIHTSECDDASAF